MTKSTCAITGTSGYLGNHLKVMFKQRGWQVLELIRNPKASTNTIAFWLGETVLHENLIYTKALVHCAYDFNQTNYEDIWRVNVEGTEKLFKAASDAGIKKIVSISTISAFEGCKSLYGQAKLEIEKIAKKYGALSIRPGLIYSDSLNGMFGRLVEQVEKSKILPLVGDGSQIQYLIHQDDLCDFIYRYCVYEISFSNTVITAAHEKGWTLLEILEVIAKNKNCKLLFVKLPWRLIWSILKAAELLHIPLKFHSDSIISLMNQNPKPDFMPNPKIGLNCRPFSVRDI